MDYDSLNKGKIRKVFGTSCLIYYLDCNNEIYLTLGLVFIVLFIGSWACSMWLFIRPKKVKTLMAILLKKREKRVLKVLNLEKFSQNDQDDKKIDEKSFASFFRMSTVHYDVIDTTTKWGASITNPIIKIYKYNWTVGEYYSLWVEDKLINNKFTRASKVSKLHYNNLINDLNNSQPNSDNSAMTDHAISDLLDKKNSEFIPDKNKIEKSAKEKRRFNIRNSHSFSSEHDVMHGDYKMAKPNSSKRSSAAWELNDSHRENHSLIPKAEIPKVENKVKPYKASKRRKIIRRRKKVKKEHANEPIVVDSSL